MMRCQGIWKILGLQSESLLIARQTLKTRALHGRCDLPERRTIVDLGASCQPSQALGVGFFETTSFLKPPDQHICPASRGNVESVAEEKRTGPPYLEEVCDFRVNPVDESNAIAEDSRSLTGVQSGLEKGRVVST